MINAIIVDDEELAIINLKRLIETKCPQINIAATATSVDKAYDSIVNYKPGIVFLDIEMPPFTGFDLLKKFSDFTFEVIFITAHNKYGIDAVKFSALDYILKPINTTELIVAVEKALIKIKLTRENAELKNLIGYLQNENMKSKHKIAVASLKETRFIFVKEIVRLESNNSYTTITLSNSEKLISTTSMYEYEELLGKYEFIRCHQSHLVNKVYVKSFSKRDGYVILLENGDLVPVSRQNKDIIKKTIASF